MLTTVGASVQYVRQRAFFFFLCRPLLTTKVSLIEIILFQLLFPDIKRIFFGGGVFIL